MGAIKRGAEKKLQAAGKFITRNKRPVFTKPAPISKKPKIRDKNFKPKPSSNGIGVGY